MTTRFTPENSALVLIDQRIGTIQPMQLIQPLFTQVLPPIG